MFNLGLFGGGKKKSLNRIINRDPNNQLDFRGLSIEDSQRLKFNNSVPGFTGNRLNRGDIKHSALNYEHMSRLGSSAAARSLQKEAFAKLQNDTGGLRPNLPGRLK
jgi:hypothetical protein